MNSIKRLFVTNVILYRFKERSRCRVPLEDVLQLGLAEPPPHLPPLAGSRPLMI